MLQRVSRAALGGVAVLALAACDSAPAPVAPTQAASGTASGAPDGVAAVDAATDLLRRHREALAISEVALDRAANAEVRALAEQTQKDYRAGERELLTLLASLGEAEPDAEAEPPTLPGARGAEFDRAFLIAMADHLNGALQAADSAAAAPSAELQAFAEKHATAATETLAEVRELQGA